MSPIYLDHNATTPLHPEVLEAMRPYFGERFGNPSSPHAFGREARQAIDRAREQVAALIGARPEELVFTSGGTEADNQALVGALAARRPRTEMLVSAIEHQAVLDTCTILETFGARVVRLPVDHEGRLQVSALDAALSPQTAVVSVMLANNEVGTLQPVAEVARRAHGRGALVHCDAVQALGRVAVDVGALDVDLLSLSAHKVYGPKGAGALFVRRGVELPALLHGGHQESQRRAGTENVAAIVGFGWACQLARERLESRAAHARRLRDRLEQGILAAVPSARIHAQHAERLPNTANVGFEGVDSELLLLCLDSMEVAVSSTSACSASSRAPSHVLMAMGLSAEEARGALRFSLGEGNTEEEIDRVLALLPTALESSAAFR